MKIKVESCWSGNEKFSFRLTMPDGKRTSILGEKWDKKLATEALNMFENLYGFDRRSIRFVHK